MASDKGKIHKHTLDTIIAAAIKKHVIEYDYSENDPEKEWNSSSILKMKCKGCGEKLSMTVTKHINSGMGCKSCKYKLKLPALIANFFILAALLHGNKFTYFIRIEDITGRFTDHIILIKCNDCDHEFKQRTKYHLAKNAGCLSCADKLPYTLESFLAEVLPRNKDLIDYSNVTEAHIKGRHSKVPLKCKKCQHEWEPTIASNVDGHGCPVCKNSQGELAVKMYLQANDIQFKREFKLQALKNKPFDFMIPDHQGRKYLIEYDGRQHFVPVAFFQKKDTTFEERKRIDIEKSVEAIKAEYHIIRIDYTCANIETFLNNCLLNHSDLQLQVSSYPMYAEHYKKVYEKLDAPVGEGV